MEDEKDAARYGTAAHERALIEAEREDERWSAYSYQDALTVIGKRETEGMADEPQGRDARCQRAILPRLSFLSA